MSTQATPLNIRGGPGTQFPVLLQLPNGTPVQVLNSYNGWYVVQYGDLVGFADSRFITL